MEYIILSLVTFMTIMSFYNVRKYRSLIDERNDLEKKLFQSTRKYNQCIEETRIENNKKQKEFIFLENQIEERDEIISNFWGIIESLEIKLEKLRKINKHKNSSLNYYVKRNEEQENKISELTWNKLIKRGRKSKYIK